MAREAHDSLTVLDGHRERKSSSDDHLDTEASYAFERHRQQRFWSSALNYLSLRRRCSRYVHLLLAALLILFVLAFLRLGTVSSSIGSKLPSPPSESPPPWEAFPSLDRYFGGVRNLVSRADNKPEYPGPSDGDKYAADGHVSQAESGPTRPKREVMVPVKQFDPYELKPSILLAQQCYLDVAETVTVPKLYMHMGIPNGMPDPVIGSYDLLGINNQGCFDRYGRLGPYGLGYSSAKGGSSADFDGQGHDEAMKLVWQGTKEVDYRSVKWGEAQDRCLQKNIQRYKTVDRNNIVLPVVVMEGQKTPQPLPPHRRSLTNATLLPKRQDPTLPPSSPDNFKLNPVPRIAIVIRTWTGFDYTTEKKMYLRALINEAAIQSGCEYTVHFLVHLKPEHEAVHPWIDQASYDRALKAALPEEFQGMGTLWSETMMRVVYAGLGESSFKNLPLYGSYRSLYMPMQHFAHMHPEYDHFWHWEMDARYTGNYYHLFDRLGTWAREQPRKGLWERNGRFYVPAEHGSWQQFTQLVSMQTRHGTSQGDSDSASGEVPIWGPLPPINQDGTPYTKDDVLPPRTEAEDQYQWGVGEDADLITLNPLFDPEGTDWRLATDVTGYNTPAGFPPRRTAIVTASRLSRRLLEIMHKETSEYGHTMFTEMWPASAALHHGLKAVYAPHPVYVSRRWPTSVLAQTFNNGRNGATGGALKSVFSENEQHNFYSTTWYYHARFATYLWERWLGLKADHTGGKEYEEAGEGRMCLPAMLLHPIKEVNLDYTQVTRKVTRKG